MSRVNAKILILSVFSIVFYAFWMPLVSAPLIDTVKADPGIYSVDIDYIVDPSGWLTGWSYRKTITIDNANVDADLTDFPLYVKISNDSDLGDNAQDDGGDVRFTLSNGTTLLKYEIESWAGGGAVTPADANIWVKVPTISGTADTDIYLYYGNSGVADAQDAANVWDSNFKAVWHLKETGTGAAGDYLDSTSNNNDSTNTTGQPTQTSSGKIDGAESFVSSYISIPDSASLQPTSLTVSSWVKYTSGPGSPSQFISKNFGTGTDESFGTWWYADSFGGCSNAWHATVYQDHTTCYGQTPTVGQWYLVTHTFNNTSKDSVLYIDGNQVSSQNLTGKTISYDTKPLTIGAEYENNSLNFYINGSIDEVRISSAARAAAWIKFEYYNMNEADAELTFAAQDPITGGNFVWTNGSGDGLWSTASNWQGGVVPGTSDTAIFNSAATGDATINANISIAGIDIQSGYTGTITQSSTYTITVGSSGWTQAAGTFTGGSGAVDINGNFSLTAGTYSQGTAVTNISGDFAISSGATFTKATGGQALTFDGTGSLTDSNVTKQDLGAVTVDGTATTRTLGAAVKMTSLTIGADDIFSLAGYNFEFSSAAAVSNAGTFKLQGGETLTSVNNLDQDSGTVEYIGTSGPYTLKSFTGVDYFSLKINGAATTFNLPSALDIDGIVTVSAGTLDVTTSNYGINVAGSWSNSGTFTARSGTVTFDAAATGKTITAGGSSFYNITFNGSGGGWTLQDTTFTVSNNLTLLAGTLTSTSGTLSVAGNWNDVGGTFTHNSGTIDFTAAAGTQTFTTLGGQTYNNITHSGAGTLQLVPWLYRKQITISSTMVSTSDQTNFPVLLYEASDANLASGAQADGDDILITSSDGLTKLSHEIEKYTSATGELWLWVKVPTLSSSSNTTLYLYYGNSTATSQQDATNVWDSNFVGVWHMNNNAASTTVSDSTSNANTGTAQQNTSALTTTGETDGALTFNGTSDYVSFTPISLSTVYTGTIWFKKLTAGRREMLISTGTTNYGTLMALLSDTNQIYTSDNNEELTVSWTADTNWHQMSVARSNTSVNFYIDGAQVGATQTFTSNGPIAPDQTGRYYTGAIQWFFGSIDEVRISSAARAASWIATEYNNQSAPATYETFGSQTANTFTLNVAGTLINSAGTFDANTNAVTATGLATVSGGTYTASTGTQTFNGGLTISGGIFTGSSGTVDVNNTLTLSSGTLTAPSGTFTLSGDFTISGSPTFTPGSNTVIFDGTTTLTSNAKSFNNIQIGSSTAAGSLTTADNLDIDGNLSVQNGGATTFNISNDTITIAGNLDLTNLDTFTTTSSTVTFNGASQTISGSTTFNNLTFTAPQTVTFTAGTTQTLSGAFTCAGSAGNIITLASSAASVFNLSKASGTVDCDYISVSYSNAAGGATWNPGSHSTDGGNNTGWDTTDPSTTVSFTREETSQNNITATLTCSDGSGFGCGTTYYCYDTTNECTPTTTYTSAVTLSISHNTYFRYYSVDSVSNSETTRSEGLLLMGGSGGAPGTPPAPLTPSPAPVPPAPAPIVKQLIEAPKHIAEQIQKITQQLAKTPKQIAENIQNISKEVVEATKQIAKLIVPPFAKTESKLKGMGPLAEAVPRQPPPVFQGWDIMEVMPVSELVLNPIEADIGFFAQRFPRFKETLFALGIDPDELSAAKRISGVEFYLPGLTRAVLSDVEILEMNKFAPTAGMPLAMMPVEALAKMPNNIVFARTSGELIDFGIAISVDNQGNVQQKVKTVSGKPMELVVKPDVPAASVVGFITLKRADVGMEKPDILRSIARLFTASILEPLNDAEQYAEQRGRALLVDKFVYSETRPGIFTASITAPVAEGEYEISTIISPKDILIAPKETKMAVVVNPEGYVFNQTADGRLRLQGAKVSLLQKNLETNEFELWPADKFLQKNPILTDDTGKYSFLVPKGTYKLKAEKMGYQSFESEPFEMQEDIVVNQNIELAKKSLWQSIINWITGIFKGRRL